MFAYNNILIRIGQSWVKAEINWVHVSWRITSLLHCRLSPLPVNNKPDINSYSLFCCTRWRHAHANASGQTHFFPAECKLSLFLVPVPTILMTSESVFAFCYKQGCEEWTSIELIIRTDWGQTNSHSLLSSYEGNAVGRWLCSIEAWNFT
jgi:hypothetical protein